MQFTPPVTPRLRLVSNFAAPAVHRHPTLQAAWAAVAECTLAVERLEHYAEELKVLAADVEERRTGDRVPNAPGG